MDLERFAAMSAEMDAGAGRNEVIERAGLTEDAFARAQELWLKRMAVEAARARFELTNRYHAAFLAHRSAVEDRPLRASRGAELEPVTIPRPTALGSTGDAPRMVAPRAPAPLPLSALIDEFGGAGPSASSPPVVVTKGVGPSVEEYPAPSWEPDCEMTLLGVLVSEPALPFSPSGAAPTPGAWSSPAVRESRPDLDQTDAESTLVGQLVGLPPPSMPFHSEDSLDGRAPFRALLDASEAERPAVLRAGPSAGSDRLDVDTTLVGQAIGAIEPALPFHEPGPPVAGRPFPAALAVHTEASRRTTLRAGPSAGPDRLDVDTTLVGQAIGAIEPALPFHAPARNVHSQAAHPAPAGASRPSLSWASQGVGSNHGEVDHAGETQPMGPVKRALPFREERSPDGRKPLQDRPALAAPAGASRPSDSRPGMDDLPFHEWARPPDGARGAAPGPAAPGGPSSQIAGTCAVLSLEQFAALAAEIAGAPTAIAFARKRYGVDQTAHTAQAAEWHRRFGADPSLYRRYVVLFEHYRLSAARGR